MRNPGEIAGDVASRGEERKLGDVAAAAMALPDAKAAETATSSAPVSHAEPGVRVPPGKEQTPEALGADDPDDWRQTALRWWNRVASESSEGSADARLVPRGP
jgi:hypothetical protein